MSDEAVFARAVDRIGYLILALGGTGAIAASVLGGFSAGGGFLLGAGASYLNFRWLKRLVDALGAAAGKPGKPPRARVAVFLGLRYLILGAGAYVILRGSALSLPAALAGLFVSAAAVMAEILFELAYGRH